MNPTFIETLNKNAAGLIGLFLMLAAVCKVFSDHFKARTAEAKEKSVGAEALKNINEKLSNIEKKFEEYRQEQFKTTKQLQEDIHDAYIKMVDVFAKTK